MSTKYDRTNSKLINKSFRRYNSIGEEEIAEVNQVLQSGILSDYIGAWNDKFYGGKYVKECEKFACELFGVKHAITVNSWTSGLECAVGSINLNPGDEVITSPWTMSATAISILHWNAVPVFADICPDSYCITAETIRPLITSKTKAIIAVDIFGRSAELDQINKLAKEHNLKVISDTAQAPWASYKGKLAGTLADIGGYSLNFHKHINCGEGGIIVTNDDELAERAMLIRNHAESVVEKKGVINLSNMIGHNFRMGEIEAAITIHQLKKLPKLAETRSRFGNRLVKNLKVCDLIKVPEISTDITNVYYVFPIQLVPEKLNASREQICKALEQEGIPGVQRGYQNLHMLPVFQKKQAYGNSNFPWLDSTVSYAKGICPVAEILHEELFIGLSLCHYEYTLEDMDLISEAILKVLSYFKA